jgi:hypothetical protein
MPEVTWGAVRAAFCCGATFSMGANVMSAGSANVYSLGACAEEYRFGVAGNVVKVKQQKKTLNNKEKKKAKKLKEARRARLGEVNDSE